MERAKTHPILIAAGVAVLLFSLLGAAALTGVLPVGNTGPADPAALAPMIPLDHPSAHLPARPNVPQGQPVAQGQNAPGPCASCGVIESIRVVEFGGPASGIGAVAGGVLGGVVGNQIGHGGVRTLLTIGGAAGGAYAGNEIERNSKRRTEWRVSVRLEDGTLRALSQKAQPPFAVGDRVRIVDGSWMERA